MWISYIRAFPCLPFAVTGRGGCYHHCSLEGSSNHFYYDATSQECVCLPDDARLVHIRESSSESRPTGSETTNYYLLEQELPSTYQTEIWKHINEICMECIY